MLVTFLERVVLIWQGTRRGRPRQSMKGRYHPNVGGPVLPHLPRYEYRMKTDSIR